MDQLNILKIKKPSVSWMIKLDIFIKKVESESVVNVHTIKQEKEEDRLDRNMDEDDVNLYHEIITNKSREGEYNYNTNGTMVNTQSCI